MRGWPIGRLGRLGLGAVAVLAGCGDDFTQPERKSEDLLVVSVSFSGLLPSRTVQVIVNDTLPLTVEGPTFKDPLYARAEARLPLGSYRVRITGLDPNCAAPAPQQGNIRGLVPAFVAFRIECNDDLALVGRGLSWTSYVEDDWGGSYSPLSIRTEDGQVIRPSDREYTEDAVWSERGDVLAVLGGWETSIVFLAPDGSLLPLGWHPAVTSAAIAWLPGQDVLGVLDLTPSSCEIRFVEPAATSLSQHLSCGDPSFGHEYGGDIAWSPDGLTAAIAVGLEPRIRLVNRQSGEVVMRSLPGGLVPGAVEWSGDGSTLFVIAGSAGRLTLLKHNPGAESWTPLATWNTSGEMSRWSQTLELLDPGHLAVGLIEGSIHVVSLDAPGQSRVFLPWEGYRLSRRP